MLMPPLLFFFFFFVKCLPYAPVGIFFLALGTWHLAKRLTEDGNAIAGALFVHLDRARRAQCISMLGKHRCWHA